MAQRPMGRGLAKIAMKCIFVDYYTAHCPRPASCVLEYRSFKSTNRGGRPSDYSTSYEGERQRERRQWRVRQALPGLFPPKRGAGEGPRG